MSQITYRANLSAKSFPFISKNWGQSIIIPGPDNTFNRQLASAEDPDKDVGIPQIYYCHNVFPDVQGFQSIGFNTVIAGVEGKNFESIFILEDSSGTKLYLGITLLKEFYINTGTGWIYKTTYSFNDRIYVAHSSGVSYIWLPGIGCLTYDFNLEIFVPITLTGLDVNSIKGICSSFGYLIVWDNQNVAWSSTIDATDFTPSLVTGAGGGAVEGVKGKINFCVPHTLGIFIYCGSNTVVGVYSGNPRYPFNFREIVNSGGVSNPDLVTYEANTGNHYAYTTSGLQLISSSASQTIMPEVTDFISGLLFEDFNENTLVFTSTILTSTLKKRLNVISDRYLILSYGINSLTHAIVYDISQKRWGKIKLTHVDCFEYALPATGVFEIPKQSIAFLQLDGTIKLVDFSPTSTIHTGVILLGKYQYVRARLIELNEVRVENINTPNFFCKVFSSLDGKNGVWTSPFDASITGQLNKNYLGRSEGINHSLLFCGTFNLVSLELVFTVGAKR